MVQLHDIRFPRRPENYLALISRQIIRKHNRTDTDGQIRRMEIRFVEAREARFPSPQKIDIDTVTLFLFLSLFLPDPSSLSRLGTRAKLRHDHAILRSGIYALDTSVKDVRQTSERETRSEGIYWRIFFFFWKRSVRKRSVKVDVYFCRSIYREKIMFGGWKNKFCSNSSFVYVSMKVNEYIMKVNSEK